MTPKIPKPNPSLSPPRPQTVYLSVTSPGLWNTSRDGDPPTLLVQLCQCIAAPLEKKCFLISNLSSTSVGSHGEPFV